MGEPKPLAMRYGAAHACAFQTCGACMCFSNARWGLQMSFDGPGARALDLAVIGNCRSAALMDTKGRISWWCFPRFDSDPVLSRLLAGDVEKGFSDVVL